MTENLLTEVPECIGNLKNLEELNLRENKLTDVPDFMGTLQNITKLDLRENRLAEIPKCIGNLKNLEELNLRENKLTEVPDFIGKLQNLTALDLRGNGLIKIPESIGNLKNLETLSLMENGLAGIPESIGEIRNLRTLALWNNLLIEIPESIGNLKNLEVVALGENNLAGIPKSVSKLKNLRTLDLAANRMTEIPTFIGNLTSLTKLNFGDNQVTEIPESIGNLKNLKELKLEQNKLDKIPEWIGSLKNLTTLDFSGNQLTEIPGSIGNLKDLRQLTLRENRLTEIPESVDNLKKVWKLDLERNQLTDIPESVVHISDLKYLYVTANPLKSPPIEVAEKGVEAIKDYFRQLREEGQDYIYEAKLLIVGEPGAGKTTLANKIQNPDFEVRDDEKSTEGVEVFRWLFTMEKDGLFRVNIWDFGGQEIYHATHQFFLTKRSLYCLVADTRKDDTDFYYWLNAVELLSDNSPLIIIKNERHERRREINEHQLRGQFTNFKIALATNFATNRGLNDIVSEIKHYISNLPHIGSPLPKTWKNVRQVLEKDPRNYISLDEYLDICDQNCFTQLKDKLQLSSYLHDLGVCLHFQDDPLLKKSVILKPEWSTGAVYKLLDSETVINNRGRFNRDELATIWHEEKYATMHDELLQLMIKFKLCYKIPGSNDTYIAPQLLTENQPDYEWDETSNLILRYTYEFLPKGIITQFIVAMNTFISDQKNVWKSGVILEKDETEAEVIEYYGKREIRIRVAGKRKKNLMTIVTYELDKIHASYRRLKYIKLIPCNCVMCKDRQELHFYAFEVLQKFKDDGQLTIQCQRSYQMVDVLGLIDDVIEKKMLLKEDERTFEHHPVHSAPEPRIEPEKEIFISYAWGGESEKVVEQVEKVFGEKGVTIVRDKKDLAFKGRIKEFMERVGRGKCVIVIISESYLKSENCMFELVQVAKNGHFHERIFPVVLPDARIYEPLDRANYAQYWQEKTNELNAKIKGLG